MFKEPLEEAECHETEKHNTYLNEYFDEYEKEFQMEEFLGNFSELVKLIYLIHGYLFIIIYHLLHSCTVLLE